MKIFDRLIDSSLDKGSQYYKQPINQIIDTSRFLSEINSDYAVLPAYSIPSDQTNYQVNSIEISSHFRMSFTYRLALQFFEMHQQQMNKFSHYQVLYLTIIFVPLLDRLVKELLFSYISHYLLIESCLKLIWTILHRHVLNLLLVPHAQMC